MDTDTEISTDEGNDVSSVVKMSMGFKELILPPVEGMEKKLNEISKNQKDILFIAEKEREEILNIKYFREIEQRFQKVPEYIQKTKNLKKDMKLIQDKLRKLRKKANQMKQDFGVATQ